jgi:hypothetical protein
MPKWLREILVSIGVAARTIAVFAVASRGLRNVGYGSGAPAVIRLAPSNRYALSDAHANSAGGAI